MTRSDERQDAAGVGPSKIAGFEPTLTRRRLVRDGGTWYAVDPAGGRSADEAEAAWLPAGRRRTVIVDRYERDPAARRACLDARGVRCAACDLLSEERYGVLGAGFIHVHHLTPVGGLGDDARLDPVRDLVPVCPNCHAMLHATDPPLTVGELKRRMNASTAGDVAADSPPGAASELGVIPGDAAGS